MRIHLIGIGGIAMGNLAAMLKEAGHQVSGSDHSLYPPMSEKLADWGIEVYPFSAGNLKNADLSIVGNVISRGNPEVEYILNQNLPRLSMPQALSTFFLKDRQPIVVAGTHGKTTISFLLDHILQTAGKKAGLFAGGIRKDGMAGFRIGDAPYFVIEGDEYDSAFFDKGAKFLHYNPRYLILTSIEHDHADIYADEESYQRPFSYLLRLIPSQGLIVACADSKAVRNMLRSYHLAPVEWYAEQKESKQKKGKQKESEYRENKQKEGEQQERWEGRRRESSAKSAKTVSLNSSSSGRRQVVFPYVGAVEPFSLSGRHNRLNAFATVLLAKHLQIPADTIREALISFPGVLRRQQTRLTLNHFASGYRLSFIEDFAHHPTAVAATLQAVREDYPGRQLHLLFEPRSASSHNKRFQEDYFNAFRKADHIYLTDLFQPDRMPTSRRLKVRAIAESLNQGRSKNNPKARYASNPQKLLQQVQKNFRPSPKGDVLLALSNGNFGGIYSELELFLKEYPFL